ncbi:MAG: pyridoxal phosphate-dependent aminotransferase [Rickettsiales bacterium]|nr:pyridoxal phosphate-dependent aminotransferase [Rickettsiales bacterium]
MSSARDTKPTSALYREVEKSQTLLLNEQSRNIEAAGREVFKFGFGQSPFPPLSSAIEKLKEVADAKAYSPVQGLPELREKIAAFHREVDGIDIDAERVLIAPGSKILIYAAMAVFDELDVLVPAPAWVSYAPQAKLLRHTVLRIQTSEEARWRVCPEALEKTITEKANPSTPSLLILTYPGNPDGLTYSEAELQALAETCKRHQVTVISDEIYGMLNHAGTHCSMAKYHPDGTIVTGGLSKWCGAGGWRMGMAMLPKALDGEYKQVLLGVASETYSCAPTPIQIAACEAYNYNDEVRTYLSHQRKLLSFIGNWSAEQLREVGIKVHSPQGGFYLFVDFSGLSEKLLQRGINSSQLLCEHLLRDTGVALLSGDVFGIAPAHVSARLAYVEFDGKEALELSKAYGKKPLDEDALRGVFGKTARGIETICDWVRQL